MNEKKFFYSNSLELGVSPYDFSFKFLRRSAAQQEGAASDDGFESVINDELIVYMSPSHAKTLIPMLSMAVKAYEQQFGKIPLPQEKSEEFDSFIENLINYEK